MKAKNFILLPLLFVFVIFNNKTNAQNFVPVGAVWYYNRQLIPLPNVSYKKFESLKDTLVNGLNCKFVCLSYPTNNPENSIIKTNYYIFYSIDNKVFTIASGQQNLLYDFTKNEGEYWLMPQNEDTVFVDSVKNIVLTNGQTRRVQYVHFYQCTLDLCFVGPVIENIGNTNFLLPYVAGSSPPEGPMRCYSENGLIVYNEFQPCDYQSGVKENNSVQDKIEVQNPVINTLNIHIVDLSLLPLKTINIYNSFGKLICQKNQISNNNIVIDFSDKSNGFYYVKIVLNNNELITKKIIKN
jgi:hypothetical protein